MHQSLLRFEHMVIDDSKIFWLFTLRKGDPWPQFYHKVDTSVSPQRFILQWNLYEIYPLWKGKGDV